MSKNLFIIIIIISSMQLFANNSSDGPQCFPFDVGDTLHNNTDLDTSHSIPFYFEAVQSTPAKLYPAIIDNTTYYIGLIRYKDNELLDKPIVYAIYTKDSSFITPEGLKVGDSFKKAISKTNKISCWASGYYVEDRKYLVLPSGWMAKVSHKVPIDESKRLVTGSVYFGSEIDITEYEHLKIFSFLKYDLFCVTSPDRMIINSNYFETIKKVLPDYLNVDTNNFKFISVYPLECIHYKFHPLEVNNITYYINLEENVLSNSVNSEDIRTVYVRDSNFTTPEGIRVKDPLPKKYLTSDYIFDFIRLELGKDIAIIKLPSGWYAKVIVNFEDEIDRYFIDEPDKATVTGQEIQYFYQSKYLKEKSVDYDND